MLDQTTATGGQIVQAMFDAVLAQDIETLTRLLHPRLTVVEPTSLPYGGTYQGRDAFLGDLLQQMLDAFELGLEDTNIIDGGDTVVGQMTRVFTSRRTGEVLHIPYVEVYTFDDGQIRTVTVYPADTVRIVEFMQRAR